ncbi:hypothetical protein Tco_0702092 [Tanacetum coccineum]|uniref:Retrovirus-related Pol polyprotein from transposon TNT 1-94 n=1 Tax=Tanacetum coccineum TaxID=301880 RepID=A0ABQ4XVM8_9ASTR
MKRTRVLTKDQNDSLMAQLNNKSNENVDVLAQIQKKGFAIAALKNELRKLTGNSVNTKFAKPSILGKPVLQPHRNQSVVRQPTAFKSERPKISKERFASQVDVSNDLSKPVTTHYLPKRRESAPAKPHYMIATSSSRYSLKYGTSFTYRGRTQSLVAKKKGKILRKHASRKFDSDDPHKDYRTLAPQRQDVCLNCLFRLVPQGQKASDYDNSDPVLPRQNVVPLAEKTYSSQQDIHPLEQVRGNPTMPVQTRRQLATDLEMCMFALTEEGIDFEESFAPVARLEASSIIRCHEAHKSFYQIYQMDVKTHFLRSTEGEVTLLSLRGSLIHDHPEKVYVPQDSFIWIKASSRSGLQIHQSPKGIFINQAKYALEILKKHNMDNCHSIGTPLATKPKLDVDLSGEPVDQSDYRSKIGSLMYLTSSRPDLVQAVCYCARYQARPTQKHLKEVKRIFKYLKGTINMGLWYPKDSGFELTAFSDADHAGCLDTRKSTSGGIQFLGDKLVSWMSKKQNCTAMSSAEAEYVALSASCAQVMWMRTQLQDYGFNYNKIPLYCDSQSAIAISCNPVQHSRTKHIHTRYHFIKEQVENGIIELYFVRTEYQLADMFTKALPEDRFKYLVRRIGMRCLTPAELEVLTNETA